MRKRKEAIPKTIKCPDLVMHMSDGYTFQEEEWKRYHDFKPSIFQRIFWIFWPTQTSIKWQMYKDISIKDIRK